MDGTLAILADKATIDSVLRAYCRAVDRVDRELLRSCYWEDAVEDHGRFFSGGRDEWVDVCIKVATPLNGSSHFLSNVTIELEDDTAFVESYLLVANDMDDGRGERILMTAGVRNVDRFERRGEDWRIARRLCVFDWTHAEPLHPVDGDEAPGAEPGTGSALRMGQRSRQDPAYLENARTLLA